MSKKLVTPSRQELGFSCICGHFSSNKSTAKGLLQHVEDVHDKDKIRLCMKRDCFLTYKKDQVHVCLPEQIRQRAKAKAKAAAEGGEPVE